VGGYWTGKGEYVMEGGKVSVELEEIEISKGVGKME
jgi:hypothetical protein